MKAHYILPVMLFCFSNEYIYSQAPQAIPYQAVARNNAGSLIANQAVSLRFSIKDISAAGTVVYRETQTATTNALGLFTVNIGLGTVVTGTFSSLNWGIGSKFMQVEMDVSGGTTYIDMGTQQMLSVPYALYSAISGSVSNGWKITGNTSTVDGANFIGNTDNVPFSIRVNNQKAGRIDNTNHNVSLGYESMRSLSPGTYLTVLGDSALYNSSSSFEITALGSSALKNNSGFYNTAIGVRALYNNGIGSNNTATGKSTLYSNNNGEQNTASGAYSLYQNISGGNNTASGFESLNKNISGYYNTAMGSDALFKNISGNNNTGIGTLALFSDTSGTENTASGRSALYWNSNGSYNSAHGAFSLYLNTTGTYNTAHGGYSLYINQTGSYNSACGYQSLYSNQTGGYNSALGNMALYHNISGTENTAVGNSSDVASGALVYATAIGAHSYVASNYSLVLGSIYGINNSAGNTNVGIGTTTPGALLSIGSAGTELTGAVASTTLRTNAGNLGTISGNSLKLASIGFISTNNSSLGIMAYRNGAGSDWHSTAILLSMDVDNTPQVGGAFIAINNNGNIGINTSAPAYTLEVAGSAGKPTTNTWTITSDARLKTNVHDYTDGLSKLLKIHPVWFTYTGEAGMPKETGVGVLAQELQPIAPYMVGSYTYIDSTGRGTDYLNMNNGAMTYMLINSVKEQQQQIEDQKKMIAAITIENENLKADNASFRTDIEKIKAQLGMEAKAGK